MYSVQQTSNNNEEGIDLKKVILFFINNLFLFCLSIFVFVTLSFIYLRYATPTFNVSAKILVADQDKGGSLFGGDAGGAGGIM